MAEFNVKLGVRAGETGNWNVLRQRTALAGDPGRIRAGDNPAQLAGLVDLRGARQIAIPEMVSIYPKLSIMRTEITVGLFKQVMEGYEITGHNADQLKAVLADASKAGHALTYVSLLDAEEFAKRLSAQTGRNFRVQTEDEWLKAGGQLSGSNWTWTETPYSGLTYYVLRHLNFDDRLNNDPELRYRDFAVRLVEDLAA
jgi:hypothetical protein